MKLTDLLKNQRNYVLLDSNAKENKKYFFANPIKILEIFDPKDFNKALIDIDQYSKTHWLAGYISYDKTKKPLLWFGVYEKPEEFSFFDDEFFYKPYIKISSSLDFQTFEQKIHKIKCEIKSGNTYQVNFTFNNIIEAFSSFENMYL